MPDVQANIILNTSGGDASASEINKASTALGNVTTSSSALQTKFQERFQHVGLSIFAGQALESIGLSGETRQAVMLMNTAITGAEAAGGIASGGLTLMLTALVAVGAAVYKVVSGEQDLSESLEQTAEADAKALVATNDKIAVMKAYGALVNHLPSDLASLLAAEQRVAQDQSGALKSAVEAATDAIKSQDAAMVHHIETSNMWKGIWAGLVEGTETLTKSVVNLASFLTGGVIPTFDSWAAAAHSVVSALSGVSSGVYMSQEQYANLKSQIDKNIAAQKELAFEAAHGGQTMVEWAQKQAKAEEDAKTKALDALSQISAAEKIQTDMAIKLQHEITADKESQAKIQEQAQTRSLQKQQQEINRFANTVSHDFATMFKGMITQNQSFSVAFQKMADEMLDQFIQMLLDMGIKWVVQQALQLAQSVATNAAVTSSVAASATANVGIWSSMTAAMVAEWEILRAAIMSNPYTAASEPAAASASYTADSGIAGGVASAGKAAIGGSFFADTPTVAMFGENGPEMATFSPMSGGGTSAGRPGSSGGGNSQVNNIEINIQGVVDQNLVNQIGQKIVQTIRGQGQISFS